MRNRVNSYTYRPDRVVWDHRFGGTLYQMTATMIRPNYWQVIILRTTKGRVRTQIEYATTKEFFKKMDWLGPSILYRERPWHKK